MQLFSGQDMQMIIRKQHDGPALAGVQLECLSDQMTIQEKYQVVSFWRQGWSSAWRQWWESRSWAGQWVHADRQGQLAIIIFRSFTAGCLRSLSSFPVYVPREPGRSGNWATMSPFGYAYIKQEKIQPFTLKNNTAVMDIQENQDTVGMSAYCRPLSPGGKRRQCRYIYPHPAKCTCLFWKFINMIPWNQGGEGRWREKKGSILWIFPPRIATRWMAC